MDKDLIDKFIGLFLGVTILGIGLQANMNEIEGIIFFTDESSVGL